MLKTKDVQLTFENSDEQWQEVETWLVMTKEEAEDAVIDQLELFSECDLKQGAVISVNYVCAHTNDFKYQMSVITGINATKKNTVEKIKMFGLKPFFRSWGPIVSFAFASSQ